VKCIVIVFNRFVALGSMTNSLPESVEYALNTAETGVPLVSNLVEVCPLGNNPVSQETFPQ